jgi:replicative DNA helicase
MVVLQLLNRIIKTSDMSLVIDNNLTKEMFLGYEEEFDYIQQHYEKYHKVPDKETFLSEFTDFDLLDVAESNKYLLDKLNEEWLYYKTVPVVQKVAELLKSNSDEAVEYLLQEIPKLTSIQQNEGTDIIKNADVRLKTYKEKLNGKETRYITTGFEELDTLFKGFAKGEELVVLFARIGQGKSWVLSKMLSHAWQIGLNVGMISPEMSATKIGYRFDTLTNNFSNKNLVWGQEEKDYENYIQELKQKDNKFIVSIPQDFNKKITVGKLKNFCIKNKLDILGIDGITYLTDERYKKGDNRTTMLTNISEDLMSLSIELGIPILVVVQSNRRRSKNRR